MALIRRVDNTAYWVSANEADPNCIIFYFSSYPSQEVLDAVYQAYLTEHEYDSVGMMPVQFEDHVVLLVKFVKMIKNNPNLTLSQYNNYLATLPWYEASVIRFFVFTLAIELSKKYNVTLDSMTETQVLQKVRDWLVATPGKKIYKVVFGYVREL